jgi:propionate CoA-transferase
MSRLGGSASKVCDLASAVSIIADHQSVACAGVLGWITPDAVLGELGNRFDRTGSPRELSFFFPCATGDAMGIAGMDHVARPGLMRRIVSGSYINPRHPETGARPALSGLIQQNLIAAHSWPIGACMHWLREVARGSPGYLTRIGLGTYIDPRHGGGRFTALAEDVVRTSCSTPAGLWTSASCGPAARTSTATCHSRICRSPRAHWHSHWRSRPVVER